MAKKNLHVTPGKARTLLDLSVEALGGFCGFHPVNPEYLDAAREKAFSSADPVVFAEWYLRSECLSKFNDDHVNPDLAAAAIDTFIGGESSCLLSNGRLYDPWSRCSLDQRLWRRARARVAQILGRFDFEEFVTSCGFGPGASTGLRRKASSHQNKWGKASHITAEALPYHIAFCEWAGIDIPRCVEVVAGNRVTTVPKSYKTDRCIAIEPDWNMFYQKGLGAMIRRRLQRHDILTRDAQDLNKASASEGAKTGLYATIDLKAASDSISMSVVAALLPDSWARHFFNLRSKSGVLPDGKVVRYEKISSMGNGFTFELETLIFYALMCAVCEKDELVRVYGDDIIVPTHRVSQAVSLLAQAGFETNAKKSFSEGPFRESCGGHYWGNVDVTPFYIRRLPDTIGDVINLHNHVIAWHARLSIPLSEEWRAVVKCARSIVPRSLWGPYLLDGVLWAEWDECTPVWHKGQQRYAQKAIKLRHRYTDVSCWSGSFLYKLWMENPESEASRLAHKTSVECVAGVPVYRDQWLLLPVRLA